MVWKSVDAKMWKEVTGVMCWGNLMWTIPWWILWSISAWNRRRLCCNAFQRRVFNMLVTLDSLRKSRITNRAACRWIFSTICTFLSVHGFHTQDAYSNCGLTNWLYAISFTCRSHAPRVLLMKPRVLAALGRICSTWLFQLRFSEMTTPKYFAVFTLAISPDHRWCMYHETMAVALMHVTQWGENISGH